MPVTRRVLVSFAAEDAERCQPLLAALDAWGVDYYAALPPTEAGQTLDPATEVALAERNTFLRICTAAAQRSPALSLQVNAFRGLQAGDRGGRGAHRRLLINLILASDYQREPFDNATLFIDGVSRPRSVWMADLGRALGVNAPVSNRVSRRAILGYSAAAVVTVGAVVTAGDLYVTNQQQAQTLKDPPGTMLWQLNGLGADKDVPPLPILAGNHMFVSSGYALYAYDLSTRRRLWRNVYSARHEYGAPTVDQDRLYAIVDNNLYSLDAATGKQHWSAQLPSSDPGEIFTSPIIGDGAVFVLSDAGNLHAFSTQNGSPRWSDPIDAPPIRLDYLYGDYGGSAPRIAGTTLYIGSLDHQLHALNTRDGSTRWKFLSRGTIVSTPAIVNGVVYFGSRDNYVYALDAATGALKWKYRTQGFVEASPTVADGVVYIGSDDKYLYALDAATGQPYWRVAVGDYNNSLNDIENSGPIYAAPIVTGDAVIVLDNTTFIVRSYTRHNGMPRWKFTPTTTLQNATPVGANGLVVFGAGDKNIYAFVA